MRLFIAIEVAEVLRHAIAERIETSRRMLPPASWVRPAALHLTLVFAGEQHESVVPAIASSISAATSKHESFSLAPGSPGLFPPAKPPRVGWIGLEPSEPLVSLAQSIRERLTASSVPFDTKQFVPHLTVCRMRNRWTREASEQFLVAFDEISVSPFPVSEVVLFRSELTAEGAVHTPLHLARLSSV